MLSTFMPPVPSEQAKSISLSKSPVFPTNILVFTELALSACADAIVGAVVENIVAVVVLTLTTIHYPRNATSDDQTRSQGL